MGIKVVTFGAYFTGPREAWTGVSQATYAVNAFTKALKGIPLKNYNEVPVKIGGATRTLDSSTAAQAFDWFAELAANHLGQASSPTLLIPIPGSQCDSQAAVQASTTMKMADALARRLKNVQAHPALWFDTKLTSASKAGGPRHPRLIYPHLVYDPSTPHLPVVLVDDVCTSGGHVRACAARLRDEFHTCDEAICAVQSTDLAPETPWRIDVRELEDFDA